MLRNVLMLISASVGAQLISVAFLPVLSRLYDEEAFGVFQIYITSLNLCLMVVALRYEVALLTAGSEHRFRTLLRLIVRISVVMSVLVGIAGAIAFPWIESTYPEFTTIVFVLPVAMLAAGLLQTLTFVVIHDRRYGLSASVKFAQASGYVGAGLLFALGPLAMVGLPLADMAGRLIAAGTVLSRIKGLLGRLFGPLSRTQARLTAWRFRDYPIYTMPGTFLSSAIGVLVSITFLGMFDLGVAGQYALVDRFILLPVGLIAGAATQVFTGDFAEQVRNGSQDVNRKFRSTVLVLMAVAVVPAVALYFSAPVLVPFVFGEQWQLAGQLCQIAVAIAVVRFVAGPMMMVLIICNRQGLLLAWHVLRFVLTCGIFGVLILSGTEDPLEVMWYYVVSVVISYAVYLVLADRVTARFNRPVRETE